MSCPPNPPPPAGYRIWRGSVPQPLVQWAIDLRDRIRSFPYGQTFTVEFEGKTALARKDHHTWTFRGGQLVTGLCIPGITLYEPIPVTLQGLSAGSDSLTTPDPEAAVYSVDPVATPPVTDWRLVAISAAAGGTVVAAFFLALRAARPLRRLS